MEIGAEDKERAGVLSLENLQRTHLSHVSIGRASRNHINQCPHDTTEELKSLLIQDSQAS